MPQGTSSVKPQPAPISLCDTLTALTRASLDTSVRIAIVNLTSGGLSGGYRKYLVEILPRLAAHPDVDAVTVFGPSRALEQLPAIGLPTHAWTARDAWLGLPEARRQLLAFRPDVVFVPTARCLEVSPLPTVVMVRNMEPLEFPFRRNPLPEALKNRFRAHEARRACQRASRVIAVSQHVRDVILERFRLPLDRIGVVPHGFSESGRDDIRQPRWAGEAPRPPFVFTAGSIRPARGLEDLVRALGCLRANGVAVSAVIAGCVDPFMARYASELRRMAETMGVADRITWAGGLTSAEMAWCYRQAALFVMTSRAEACPNTALEAMGHGCACVSVTIAPMPEFFGDDSAYYHAGRSHELAGAIRRLLSDSQSAAAARGAATARARAFTWERTVLGTVDQLRLAVAASRDSGRGAATPSRP